MFSNEMKKCLAVVVLVALMLIGANVSYSYDTNIFNGNFETGDLAGWLSGGINGGFTTVVEEGTLFSAYNTLGLTLNGDFALNIRSSGPAPINSIGILTSDFFIAGSWISFSALSENSDDVPIADSVSFSVNILDTVGNILLSQAVTPNLVTLGWSESRDGIFSTHKIDTSVFAGQTVQLEFQQHTNVQGSGFFTLIDDIVNQPANPAPEPATITLMGLGLIVLGGGRKFRHKKFDI